MYPSLPLPTYRLPPTYLPTYIFTYLLPKYLPTHPSTYLPTHYLPTHYLPTHLLSTYYLLPNYLLSTYLSPISEMYSELFRVLGVKGIDVLPLPLSSWTKHFKSRTFYDSFPDRIIHYFSPSVDIIQLTTRKILYRWTLDTYTGLNPPM